MKEDRRHNRLLVYSGDLACC